MRQLVIRLKSANWLLWRSFWLIVLYYLVWLQVQQRTNPCRWHHCFHFCHRRGAVGDGNSQCIPPCFTTSLGGVSKQVLWGRRLQVSSILIFFTRWRGRVEENPSCWNRASECAYFMSFIDSFIQRNMRRESMAIYLISRGSFPWHLLGIVSLAFVTYLSPISSLSLWGLQLCMVTIMCNDKLLYLIRFPFLKYCLYFGGWLGWLCWWTFILIAFHWCWLPIRFICNF